MKWVKWKDHQGVRAMGKMRYYPPEPWGPWTKIIGVVARCEGKHDTVVSYDGTGITWGFMQWTFTSGRLQKLLQFLKSIDVLNSSKTLFDKHFRLKGGKQVFKQFGFIIVNGNIIDLETKKPLNPSLKKDKRRIDDICMGRVKHDSFAKQKSHAIRLAKYFLDAGKDEEVAFAQLEFAKNEFKRAIRYKRRPLKGVGTIANLLEDTWDTPLPAIFFNLWQNSPRATYKLFMKAYLANNKARGNGEDFFNEVWRRLNLSKFANWSYAKSKNKSPRIRRIKKAISEFYDIDLEIKRY